MYRYTNILIYLLPRVAIASQRQGGDPFGRGPNSSDNGVGGRLGCGPTMLRVEVARHNV